MQPKKVVGTDTRKRPVPASISPTRTAPLTYAQKVKRGIITSLRNKSSKQRQEFSLAKLKEMQSRGLGKSTPRIGCLYLYAYDAKWKDELEYYDQFPLMFCIDITDKGWMGLSLHYLHPVMRAKLMDAIELIAVKSGKNERIRLITSYSMLKSASRARFFRPCVKSYLKSHVRSKLLEVAKSDWDLVLSLPLARFQKAHPSKVYADSRKLV